MTVPAAHVLLSEGGSAHPGLLSHCSAPGGPTCKVPVWDHYSTPGGFLQWTHPGQALTPPPALGQ